MPIKPEHRHFYGREWRTVTRPRILARASNACEHCRVPNGALVARVDALPGYWFALDGAWHDDKGVCLGSFRGKDLLVDHLVAIKLGVAHLNQKPGDDRDENLAALCAACHLKHDRTVNAGHARQTRLTRKDAARPILAALMEGV